MIKRRFFGQLLILIVLIVAMRVNLTVAEAASNTEVHKAYSSYLNKAYAWLKKESWGGMQVRMRYAFADLNGDKSDEMVVFDAGNNWSKGIIYSYRKGKVKTAYKGFSLYVNGPLLQQNRDMIIFKSGKMIYTEIVDEYGTVMTYSKWSNGRYKDIAVKEEDFLSEKTYYSIKGKNVSSRKYRQYLKKLPGKSSGKKISTLKWHSYSPK